MKKLKLKESVKNVLAVALFYTIIVLGVIALNSRFESIEECTNEGNSYNYCVGVK